MAEKEKESIGKWHGRKPKGQQDTHSWQAFLKKTNGKILQAHLARHHRGYKKSSGS